jgi:hypothetical protein
MTFDKRTRLYKQSKQFWCAVAGLLLASLVIGAITLVRTPKVQPQAFTISEEQIKRYGHTCQKVVDDVCTNVTVTELQVLPTPTPKLRSWKYLKFKHTQYYQEVIEGLQARFTNWEPVAEIVARESSFNPNAKNSKSTAYGLGQFLDMHGVRTKCGADIECQLDSLKTYIVNRYGSPTKALAFHDRMGYY